MAIYVDELRDYPGKGQWCHMWSDGTDSELNNFAWSIGLHINWSHESTGLIGRFYHYDLRPSKRKLALKKGAIEMPLVEWIKLQRQNLSQD